MRRRPFSRLAVWFLDLYLAHLDRRIEREQRI